MNFADSLRALKASRLRPLYVTEMSLHILARFASEKISDLDTWIVAGGECNHEALYHPTILAGSYM